VSAIFPAVKFDDIRGYVKGVW